MGAGAVKQHRKNHIEPLCINHTIFLKDEAYYCIIERDKFKLNPDVLANFEKVNNFSRDQDVVDNSNIKTKSTNYIEEKRLQ